MGLYVLNTAFDGGDTIGSGININFIIIINSAHTYTINKINYEKIQFTVKLNESGSKNCTSSQLKQALDGCKQPPRTNKASRHILACAKTSGFILVAKRLNKNTLLKLTLCNVSFGKLKRKQHVTALRSRDNFTWQ